MSPRRCPGVERQEMETRQPQLELRGDSCSGQQVLSGDMDCMWVMGFRELVVGRCNII